MVFQKKIIIGSLVSFVATVLGIIAVFFPDLLNLQKEKIQKYSGSISNKKEAELFLKFLDKMVEEKKIFELDVIMCLKKPKEQVNYYEIDNTLIVTEGFEDEKNNITLSHIQYVPTFDNVPIEQFMEDCFNEFEYNTNFCSGVDYWFETEDYETSHWIGDWSRTSYTGKNDCGFRLEYYVAFALTGYFINSKSRPFRGSIENTFKTISEEQIRLKSY